jgi:succinyl-CoA synthetase alpha subunit
MPNFTSKTKVLIQGIAQTMGSTHAPMMKRYGTNVVAGVSPGQGGRIIDDIPIFDMVESAQATVGGIDVSIVCVHPYLALDAALEAIDAGIRQLILLTEGVPPLDMVQLLRKAEDTDALVVGPNTPGIIVPGKVLLGTYPTEFCTPGNIGLISRSGTLTYEVARTLTHAKFGQSIAVGIGSDAIIGSSFPQWLQILDEDEETEAIVLVGEIGGDSEEIAARYINEAIDKPVVVYVAGRHAPKGKRLGHAGAIVTSHISGTQHDLSDPLADTDVGSAQRKIEAFRQVNIPVADRLWDIPKLLKKGLKL